MAAETISILEGSWLFHLQLQRSEKTCVAGSKANTHPARSGAATHAKT